MPIIITTQWKDHWRTHMSTSMVTIIPHQIPLGDTHLLSTRVSLRQRMQWFHFEPSGGPQFFLYDLFALMVMLLGEKLSFLPVTA